MSGSYETIVVGAGVVGCAVARELATDQDVLVVDSSGVAEGATALAAGEVTMTPSYSDMPAVAEFANEFFQKYDGTESFTFTERSSVELVPPEREGEARRRTERLANNGLPIEFLSSAAAEERYPRLDTSEWKGVVRHEETGFVDPYTFATTLLADAEANGAVVQTNSAVTNLVVQDGSVRGIETEDGTIEASSVVVAAGWRTPDVLSDHVKIPVRPYRTQCVVVEPSTPLSDAFPMGWCPGEHVYFRPEHNGDLLVGGWSFAESNPEAASQNEDEGFREHVAELLPRILHGFDEARFVNGWAGVDGATPDTRPIIDAPEDGPTGLVVATGFHGRGVMTAPVAAAVTRSLVADEPCPVPRDEFSLDRFDSRSRDFEFHSISSG